MIYEPLVFTAAPEGTPHFSGELPDLAGMDDELKAELRASAAPWTLSEHTGATYANSEIASMVRPSYSAEGLQKLEGYLRETGALHIPIDYGTLTVDDEVHDVPFIAATELGTAHGDMSSMIYLRDHFQTARIYMDDPVGHELLLSGLDLLSTPSQLSCFENVILRGREAGQSEWPKISLLLNDLEGVHPNNWRNIQDTVQMAAHATLDAIDRGYLQTAELTDSHKQMLGMIVPFLEAASFPKYPSSGSWEEIVANRTSVMGIETMLLHKLKTLTEQDTQGELSFLQTGYQQFAGSTGIDFQTKLDEMIQDGLRELGRRLPFESPEYDKDSVEYREADAALAYLLLYDVPALLERYHIPIGVEEDAESRSREAIEDMLIEQLETLMDPETGGMKRYLNDSYLCTDFLTNEKQAAVNDIKQLVKAEANGGEIDLAKKQRLRGELFAGAPEASWGHPVSQVVAASARRALECLSECKLDEAERYIHRSTRYLNEVLRTITGENQVQIALQPDSGCGVQPVPANKTPECITSCEDDQGLIRFASPHTPLNWGTAQLHEGIALLNSALEQARTHGLGKLSLQ